MFEFFVFTSIRTNITQKPQSQRSLIKFKKILPIPKQATKLGQTQEDDAGVYIIESLLIFSPPAFDFLPRGAARCVAFLYL